MKRESFTIKDNREIAPAIFRLILSGDTSEITAPGQFVNIAVPDGFLRRPISISDWDDHSMTLIYKAVGKGTAAMSGMKSGENLDILIALGNGYTTETDYKTPLLIGGGIGVPPLYGLAKALTAGGLKPQVVMGFNTAEEIILTDEFRSLEIEPVITTVDGSCGICGFVTDGIKNLKYDYIYTCGPEPMLKALYDAVPDGQFSFEARMACGFGACMGCSCMTKYGSKRICKDGPVLRREEIIW